MARLRNPTWSVPLPFLVLPQQVKANLEGNTQDEIFHVPQAQAYCRGAWSYWDGAITTPPGLYVSFVSFSSSQAVLTKGTFVQISDTCTHHLSPTDTIEFPPSVACQPESLFPRLSPVLEPIDPRCPSPSLHFSSHLPPPFRYHLYFRKETRLFSSERSRINLKHGSMGRISDRFNAYCWLVGLVVLYGLRKCSSSIGIVQIEFGKEVLRFKFGQHHFSHPSSPTTTD